MKSQEAFETPALHIFYEFADVIFSVLLGAMALIINVFRCCDAPAVCDLWDRHLQSVYYSRRQRHRDKTTVSIRGVCGKQKYYFVKLQRYSGVYLFKITLVGYW